MSVTLYRKYRPQNFSELVGQNHIKETLQNEIKAGRIAHAYLFSGPKGVGKTTTARLLAKAVNCENLRGAEPCNHCRSCQEITEGRALDVIEIDAASHTQVDNVRENIIPNARTAPSRLKYKIFIIDEVHMLSLSAFNALLKILEEPPLHVIFILATTELHKLPETIISRCQRFDFRRVGISDIKKRLKKISEWEKIKVEEEVIDIIASLAEGSIRDAESILGQVFSLGEKKITKEIAELVLPRSNFELMYNLFSSFLARDKKKSLEVINELVKEGVNIKIFIDQFIDFLRQCILFKIDKNLEDLSFYDINAKAGAFNKQIERVDLDFLREIINKLIFYKKEIDYVNISQLPLELLAIDICDYKREKENSNPGNILPEEKEEIPDNKSEAKEKENKQKDSPILKEVADKWQNIVRKLNENNHSLALVLRNCAPLKNKGNELTIGCAFKFHQEKLSEKKSRKIIEDLLTDVLDRQIKAKFVVSEIKFPEEKTKIEDNENNEVDEIIESFGGEVLGEA